MNKTYCTLASTIDNILIHEFNLPHREMNSSLTQITRKTKRLKLKITYPNK